MLKYTELMAKRNHNKAVSSADTPVVIKEVHKEIPESPAKTSMPCIIFGVYEKSIPGVLGKSDKPWL